MPISCSVGCRTGTGTTLEELWSPLVHGQFNSQRGNILFIYLFLINLLFIHLCSSKVWKIWRKRWRIRIQSSSAIWTSGGGQDHHSFPGLWGQCTAFQFLQLVPVWFNWLWVERFSLNFSPLTFVVMATNRSWASAMWRWMPAVRAARTIWRMLLQNQSTTPASKTSTKVILVGLNVDGCDCGMFSSANVVNHKKF